MAKIFHLCDRATLGFAHQVTVRAILKPHEYRLDDDITYVEPVIKVSLTTTDIGAVFDLVGKMIPEEWWPTDKDSPRQWVCVSQEGITPKEGAQIRFDLRYELTETTRTVLEFGE